MSQNTNRCYTTLNHHNEQFHHHYRNPELVGLTSFFGDWMKLYMVDTDRWLSARWPMIKHRGPPLVSAKPRLSPAASWNPAEYRAGGKDGNGKPHRTISDNHFITFRAVKKLTAQKLYIRIMNKYTNIFVLSSSQLRWKFRGNLQDHGAHGYEYQPDSPAANQLTLNHGWSHGGSHGLYAK